MILRITPPESHRTGKRVLVYRPINGGWLDDDDDDGF